MVGQGKPKTENRGEKVRAWGEGGCKGEKEEGTEEKIKRLRSAEHDDSMIVRALLKRGEYRTLK